MRTVVPKSFMFEGGERAVLLLHGFTGTTADVRMLGRFLQKKGYTAHAPLYKGHGVAPEFLLEVEPNDWWQNAQQGYTYLQEQGYKKIAVAGLSLGGLLSLKLAQSYSVVGVIPMCAPMKQRTERSIYDGMIHYAKQYKERENKSGDQIKGELERFREGSLNLISTLRLEMDRVKRSLEMVTSPALVIQARHDEMIDVNSANVIFEQIGSKIKEIKWYEESTHVITLGKEKDQLHEDIYHFLERLQWG
ncbi:carboxylesterase [Bacillus sp. JCM 19034]|uniref:alpha/beta hydrolase n=1 Tax=Bacillus sp. JCM 19034 TaxID=1481928 RepID=UPI000786694D|nr:alpha/beta fold hydrolase [Bacillus sp. JCM 19034]